MTVRIKRAYEPPASEDGQRVLVDRIWPRGRSRETLRLDAWLRDAAPSNELRKWFGHDPARWQEFERRYRAQLAEPERRSPVDDLVARARQGPLTLVYGARDTEHNEARVLADLVEDRLRAG
jgi:uncharacterized protein YeaO (DUF488 family)